MTARIETTRLVQAEAEVRAPDRSYLERYRAPFSLRCGALLVDYILPVAVIAFSTVLARMGTRPRALNSMSETVGYVIAGAFALLNFVGLTAWRGQTLGKWATGLCIRRRDGEAIGLTQSLLRHLIVYPPTFLILAVWLLLAEFQTAAIVLGGAFALTLLIGFFMSAVNAYGRAPHDLLADTIVVREDVRRKRRKG